MGELPGNYHMNGFAEGVHTPEFGEISDADAKYLAGIFEMGGGMSMRPKGKMRYSDTKWPLDVCVTSKIYFNDNNEEVITGLKKKFGGSVVKIAKKNSWRWITSDLEATEIMERIKPYAPFRSPQIGAFSLLQDGIVIDKQLELAELFTEYIHGPKEYPDPDTYKDLVRDPDFLRGVYAGRGAQYRYDSGDTLRFNSQNISLMIALGQEFGIEPVPFVNAKAQRDSESIVPVSFILDFRNSTQKHFMERIAPVAA